MVLMPQAAGHCSETSGALKSPGVSEQSARRRLPQTCPPVGLTSLQLQRFKGHRDTTIPLGRITVLVGPNGAGKTSVLQALSLVGQLLNDEPRNALWGDMSPQDLLHRAGTFPIVTAVAGTDDGSPWRLLGSVSRLPVRYGTGSMGFPASFHPLSPSDITCACV
jgi:hypothetical protein